MSETTQPRAGREGDRCPPWCQSNHGGSSPIAAHVGNTGTIEFGDKGLDSIWACSVLAGHHNGRPVVAVTSHQYSLHGSPYLEVPAHRADELAAMVELLADLTPDQHRELAAAIRAAAAQITEGNHG